MQDEEGRWWAKHRETGEWNYFDGSTWVPGTPPGYERVAPEPTTDGPPTQPAATPHPEAKHEEDRRRARPWILVVGLVGIVALIAIAVYLVVSNIGGPEMARVPDVVGKPRNEAYKVLKSDGFNVEVKMRQSSEEDAGNVVQQSPSGGGKAKRDAAVAITVGEAPSSQKRPTPEEASRPTPGYNMLQDPKGGLTVEVPPSWGVDTGADSEYPSGEASRSWSTFVGEDITSSITTAPSLNSWYSDEPTTGAYIVASRRLAQNYSDDGLIYSGLFSDLAYNCEEGPSEAFQRSSLSGKMQTWYNCRGLDITNFVVAAAPEGRECVVVLQARVVDEADQEAVQHILDTFYVDCSRVS